MRQSIAAAAVVSLAASLAAVISTSTGSPAGAAEECDPFTEPVYAGQTPTGPDVLGYEFGSQEATSAEIVQYLDAVDQAREDVSTGSIGNTNQGRPIRYAVVGDPADVAAAQRAAKRLRDPSLSKAEADRIAASAPAISWMAGNVHGGEESGADAALKVLYDLSDRTDCAATAIRENTVTVIMPSQNPDGREMDTRRNAYGFDLNRDWFAGTQAETGGKIDLLWQYPPALMSDNHEMGGTEFFFPPNADPVHHEVADQSIDWINNLYGAAMADAFTEREWPFFNYRAYDLLYMGYGDTVPTTGLLSASMTYEKGGASSISDRTEQQFVATWASMSALAGDKTSVQSGIAANYRQAYAEGRAGQLEPNAVFAPGSELELQVPDEKVRHYFFRSTGPKAAEAAALVKRLQSMNVEVRRLTKPLKVKDYRPYGVKPAARTLPKGTYWVPMAQGQKHWIQAMMGEDSYVPFPYFYDVTAWSSPMLYNLDAGRSGATLKPRSVRVKNVAPASTDRKAPSIGVWLTDDGTSAYESEGWLRWLLEKKWDVPYRKLTTADINEGGLRPVDVLIVPNGDAETAYTELGASGRERVRSWLGDGGRYVGYRGGAELAAQLGLTTAQLAEPTSDVPGSLIRVTGTGPLTQGGVGSSAWNFYEYDAVMTANRRSVAFGYPRGKDFFVSGYERGADELQGTAAVVAEHYADGDVVAFAGDPNFRAFTDGTQRILWNAIKGRQVVAPRALDASRTDARTSAARDAARRYQPANGRAVLTVHRADADRAAKAIGSRVRRTDLGSGLVRLSWHAADEDGRAVLSALLAKLDGIEVVAVRVP